MAEILNIKILNELLKQHGQETSMSAKKVVWRLKGLDKRYGRYEGTRDQVNAMVKSLKENPVLSYPQQNLQFQIPGEGELKRYGESTYLYSGGKLYGTGDIADWQRRGWDTSKLSQGSSEGLAMLEHTPEYKGQGSGQELEAMARSKGYADASAFIQAYVNPQVSGGDITINPQAGAGQTMQTIKTPSGVPVQAPQNTASAGYTPPQTQQIKPIQSAPQVGNIQDTISKIISSGSTVQQGLQSLISKGYGGSELSSLPQNVDISQLPQAGTSAQSVLSSLGIDTSSLFKEPSATDIQSQLESSPAYKLLQERLGLTTTTAQAQAEADKAKLQASYEQDKNKLEQNLAEKGLAFSGIRTSDVQNLTESLAASKLSIDRELASNLLKANLDLKDYILNAVSDAITETTKGKEQAINQLNKLGYAVFNGQLIEIPTTEKFSNIKEVRGGLYDLKTNQWIVNPKVEEDKSEDIKEKIITHINNAVDQYKLNPEGFREKFIESLVNTYGSDYRDYITQQIYASMPDIVIPSVLDAITKYKDAGYSRKDIEKMYKNAGQIVPPDVIQALNSLFK